MLLQMLHAAVDAGTVATCKEPGVAGTEPAATGTDVVAYFTLVSWPGRCHL